jgi:glycosyltransferase involved in cell wall biosynthesis
VSRNTRSDLLDYYDIPPSKVETIHLGGGFLSDNTDFSERSKTISLPESFILFVGNRSGYKNFQRLCSAINRVEALGSAHLVCFGGGAFTSHEKELFASMCLPSSKIHHLSGPDAILAQLYKSASILAYPSIYEGFGIPPLEAFQFGCPVLAGANGSLPEILGDAAEFCDPYSVDSISSTLNYLLSSVKRRKLLKMKGKQRLNKFSWRQCAVRTKDLYTEIAS